MTSNFTDLDLRVNDIPVEHVSIRQGIEDGFPGGPKKLVADDPLLGEVVLTDQCVIEFQWKRGHWYRATVGDVIAFLEKLGQTNGVVA